MQCIYCLRKRRPRRRPRGRRGTWQKECRIQSKQRGTGTRRRRDAVSGRRIALTMLLIVSLLLSNVTTIVSPAAVWAAGDPPATPAATPEPDPTPEPTATS